MKVKDLIPILQKLDPELDVGCLHDCGVSAVSDLGIYEGDYQYPYGNKMIFKRDRRKFLLFGNPGNFDAPAYYDNCRPVQDLLNPEENDGD